MDAAAVPRTYDEGRNAFRRAASDAGADLLAHPITARGPTGDELTVDIARLGPTDASRRLIVLSGVHGVEAPRNSALQVDLLGRDDLGRIPDVAVVIVHAVNPWGWVHDRRQNESNVDLNRNWRRSERTPDHHQAYDDVHHLACPDVDDLPDARSLVPQLAELVEMHGVDWVETAITRGQYRHADGLHFGGHETEESCRILERELTPLLAGADRVLTVDLHTGVGDYGELTIQTSAPPDSPQDRFVRASFGGIGAQLVTTFGRSVKSGPIAAGIVDLAPHATCFAVTAEFGTAGDLAQLAATYQEQWVHRRGDIRLAEHAAARRRYRECFTPVDPEWEATTGRLGRRFLDAAVDAMAAR